MCRETYHKSQDMNNCTSKKLEHTRRAEVRTTRSEKGLVGTADTSDWVCPLSVCCSDAVCSSVFRVDGSVHREVAVALLGESEEVQVRVFAGHLQSSEMHYRRLLLIRPCLVDSCGRVILNY